MTNKRIKTEASMPVQSRVDLRTLAELLIYWGSQEFEIQSMSQLVSWTIDAFRMVLEDNKQLPRKVETLEEAYEIFSNNGLLQQSMMKKMRAKFTASRAMENLRMEGWDDKVGGKFSNQLHPKNEVKPFPGQSMIETNEQLVLNKALEIYKEKERKDCEVDIEQQKKVAMKGSRVVILDDEDNAQRAKQVDDHLRDVEMMPPDDD